jgi:hypothetical protein
LASSVQNASGLSAPGRRQLAPTIAIGSWEPACRAGAAAGVARVRRQRIERREVEDDGRGQRQAEEPVEARLQLDRRQRVHPELEEPAVVVRRDAEDRHDLGAQSRAQDSSRIVACLELVAKRRCRRASGGCRTDGGEERSWAGRFV